MASTSSAPGRERRAPVSDSAEGAPARSLAVMVDPRTNTLNFVRLVLASSVIVWHSFALSGHPFPAGYGKQIMGEFAVDGFFAISGFLLAGSWLHRPDLLTFLKNRCLRIFPAFWTCLVVVAFGIAPLAMLIQGTPVSTLFTGPRSSFHYVVENAGLTIHLYGINGTPTGIPLEHVWNGALWTLRWEFLAYLCLALLGVLRLLRRRWVVLSVAMILWAGQIAVGLHILPSTYYTTSATRFGLMFTLGCVLSVFGRWIPTHRWVVVGFVVLLALSPLLPSYRMIGAPAVAYLVVWAGGAIRSERLRLTNRDISYGMYIYGVPTQQLLAIAGLAGAPTPLFALCSLLCTAPLAALSWVFVERPALRLKSISRRPRATTTPGARTTALVPASEAGRAGSEPTERPIDAGLPRS